MSDFVVYWYDYRQNWTALSTGTISNIKKIKRTDFQLRTQAIKFKVTCYYKTRKYKPSITRVYS